LAQDFSFFSRAPWKRFKRQSGAKFLIASTQLSLTIPFKNTQNVQVLHSSPGSGSGHETLFQEPQKEKSCNLI